jgi:hypothetical protein
VSWDYGESINDDDEESDDSDDEFELRIFTDSSDDDVRELRKRDESEDEDERRNKSVLFNRGFIELKIVEVSAKSRRLIMLPRLPPMFELWPRMLRPLPISSVGRIAVEISLSRDARRKSNIQSLKFSIVSEGCSLHRSGVIDMEVGNNVISNPTTV